MGLAAEGEPGHERRQRFRHQHGQVEHAEQRVAGGFPVVVLAEQASGQTRADDKAVLGQSLGVTEQFRPGQGAMLLLRQGQHGHDAGRALDQGIERALWLGPDELAAHPVPHRSPMVAHSLRDYLANGAGPMDRLQHVHFPVAS